LQKILRTENSNMINIFRQNKWFYLPYLIFLVIAGTSLILFSKIEIHWFINQLNNKIADVFFKYYTHLGDGILIAIAIFILLFVRYRDAITVGISSIVATLLVQVFKRYILPDTDRPVLVFGKIHNLHLVDGIYMNTAHSFPSGHSATGFSIFLLFAMISDNKYMKFLFFIVAFLIAYSRIYLSQHFLIDIYVGSLIGVVSTSLIYLWTDSWKGKKLDLSLTNIAKTKKNDLKE
jgi:membrane-associated phospholipid phosphatase